MNIVVTGSSRGIGKAIAMKFAREGFNVAICSSNKTKIAELQEELLRHAPGTEILADVCDVSDKKQVMDYCNALKKEWQQVDVLVNNAGIFTPDNVLDAPEGRLEYIMNLNFFSAYYFTRELIDLFPEKGHIFNICSVASLKAYPAGSLYTISKHALLGLSRSLREELKGEGIKVTSVFPGATYTDSWSEADIPEERFMKPEDVAEIIYSTYSLSERAVVEEILLRPMLGDI